MSSNSFPSSHPAVVMTAKRAPLAVMEVPTKPPAADEAVVQVQWVGCTPLDLHQADSGLLVQYPQGLSDSFSGVIVALGASPELSPSGQQLKVGDQVMGFAWQNAWEKASQTHVTVPTNLIGRVPSNISMPAAAVVPSSLVTAIHTITADLGLELPWPTPQNWEPAQKNSAILIWGASSTVGMYALQVLRHWGYTNLIAVASSSNHPTLTKLGAQRCFDYTKPNVCDEILAAEPEIPYFIDCIGSIDNTLRPLTKIARKGAKIAVMLPVIRRDATVELEPLYEMDPKECLKEEWAEGVDVRGVRTHFYRDNAFFKEHLQSEVVPELISSGSVVPVKHRIVEGETILDRAHGALDLLRSRAPRGEKLVYEMIHD